MSKTNYAGIDYSGPGATCNRDVELGIRYGVISQNSIQPDALEDIWDKSEDLTYKAAVEDLKKQLLAACGIDDEDDKRNQFKSVIKDFVPNRRLKDNLDDLMEIEYGEGATDSLWAIVEDSFNDRYECDDRDWKWEEDGYVLSSCLQSDVFVSKSPYYTYGQFCSPCCPGAGNLDNAWVNNDDDKLGTEYLHRQAVFDGYPKTFCLGHDFFEGDKAPYPVFSVATNKRVVMVEQKEPCPNCNGSGRDTVARLAAVRGHTPNEVLAHIKDNPCHVQEFDASTETFKCFRCAGAGHEIKKVEEEV